MEPIKLLHVSDFHIDYPFEGLSEGARKLRRIDLFGAFEYVCTLAVREKVRALLITGDLFHADTVDRHSVSLVVSGLLKLLSRDIKVVILPGNHDEGVAESLKKCGGLLPNVYIFSGDTWEEYSGVDGVSFYGHPFVRSKRNDRVLASLNVTGSTGYKVGILHGSKSEVPIGEDYFPFSGDEITRSGLHYLALGHFHNFRDCSGGNTTCFYPGSPERLTFNNTAERKAVIVTLKEGKASAEPAPIPARPYLTIDCDLSTEGLPGLYLMLNNHADQEACVRLNLTGMADEQNVVNLYEVKQHFATKFLHLEINDETVVMPEVDPSDKTVKGIFLNKIKHKLQNQGLTPEEKKVVVEALIAGLTALEGGRL